MPPLGGRRPLVRTGLVWRRAANVFCSSREAPPRPALTKHRGRMIGVTLDGRRTLRVNFPTRDGWRTHRSTYQKRRPQTASSLARGKPFGPSAMEGTEFSEFNVCPAEQQTSGFSSSRQPVSSPIRLNMQSRLAQPEFSNPNPLADAKVLPAPEMLFFALRFYEFLPHRFAKAGRFRCKSR